MDTIYTHFPVFMAGFLTALILCGLIWLWNDRQALKAKLADLESKAGQITSHDMAMIEATLKTSTNGVKAELQAALATIRSEAARIEAAKSAASAAMTAPAEPAAPVTPQV